MSYFPSEPDSWSESLTPAEGVWDRCAGGPISLDYISKVEGQTSINHKTPTPDYYGGVLFTLNEAFDCRYWETFVFYHALIKDQNHTGSCDFFLIDVRGKYAWRRFGTAPSLSWEKKELPVGLNSTGWDPIDDGFDWSQIKQIGIIWHFKDISPYTWRGNNDAWVDSPYFYRGLIMVTVKSEPAGKRVVVNGEAGVTPVTWSLSAGTWTFRAEPTDFLRWEDGSTNPERTITILAPTTLTAYYKGAPLPPLPQIEPLTFLLITISIVGTVLGGIWAYKTFKK